MSYRDTVLHNKEEFDKVFREHHCKVSRAGLYIMGRNTDLGFSRLGMVIPKKYMKQAVRRNALKRRIRAYFRQYILGGEGYSVDCVVVSNEGIRGLPKQDFSTLVNELFAKFTQKLDANSSRQ